MSVNGPIVTLNTGTGLPLVGYGTYKMDDARCQRSVEHALELGYRLIDTATAYGNERGVGAALRATGVPRAEIVVAGKLRNREHTPTDARPALERSLEALGLDSIDLYLLHWPLPMRGISVDTWRQLESAHREGLAGAIGVCNFLPHHLEELLAGAEVVPALNQIEYHPSYSQPEVVSACRRHGIAVQAYSPLARGADFELPPVRAAADAHGVSPAQVILRWAVQNGVGVIPKSATPERVAANIDLFGFELTAEEMARLDALDSAAGRMGKDPETFDDPQDPV